MNFHVALANHAVWREVLAFEVRVDRHVVLRASSTNWWDEIDGSDATLLLNKFRRVLRKKQLHMWRNPLDMHEIPNY